MVKSNLIELTSELGELFSQYWLKIAPFDRRGNIVLPFFHHEPGGSVERRFTDAVFVSASRNGDRRSSG